MRLNNSCLKLALVALMILLPGIAWGGGGSTTYKYSATLTATASGNGKVYVNHNSNQTPTTDNYKKSITDTNSTEVDSSSSSPQNITFFAYYSADLGYKFVNWTQTGNNANIDNDNKTVTISVSSSDTNVPDSVDADYYKAATITANFAVKDYHIMYEDTGDEPIQTRTYHINDDAFTLPSPKWPGYRFDGWKIISESDCTNWESLYAVIQPSTSIYNRTGDVTLKGQWSLTSYDITYLLDGGTNSLNNPSKYDVTQSITLSEPSKEGFIFDGWTLESWSDDCNWEEKNTNSPISSIPMGYIGNVTLKANWTQEGDPHYIKVTVSDMKKDDHAIFDITYGSVNQQIAIHEYAIVKIPGRYETVTVTPSRWTEKTYNITPAAGYTGIDVSSGTRNNPTMFEFSAEQKSGQNIFETSREF